MKNRRRWQLKKKWIIVLIMLFIIIFGLYIFDIGMSSSGFNASGTVVINVNCGEVCLEVEIYDKETGAKLEANEAFIVDKTYIIKIYNKGNIDCDLYSNLSESEMNTFSMYLEALTSQDRAYNKTLAKASGIEPQFSLYQNRDLISVKNFKPSDKPLIYEFTLSSRLIRQMVPYGVVKDLDADIVLSFNATSSLD